MQMRRNIAPREDERRSAAEDALLCERDWTDLIRIPRTCRRKQAFFAEVCGFQHLRIGLGVESHIAEALLPVNSGQGDHLPRMPETASVMRRATVGLFMV
jgi:hypothetical protein